VQAGELGDQLLTLAGQALDHVRLPCQLRRLLQGRAALLLLRLLQLGL
jgi:hypothetical protein